MKEQTEWNSVQELNNCITEIYGVIKKINAIGVDVGSLVYQDLRNATINIQKSIAGQIDKITASEKTE